MKVNIFHSCCILLSILCIASDSVFADLTPIPTRPTVDNYECHWSDNVADDVSRDFRIYFSKSNLLTFGAFFLTAGIFANTGLDKTVQHHWDEDFHSNGTRDFFRGPKAVGGLSYYYVPIYFAVMGLGYYRDHTLFGNVMYHWGYRSLRTFLLGGLQTTILAPILGSGRPNRNEPSKWQPFKYTMGVSGHAHFGAIPFLTAAMMTDPPAARFALYIISTLPGISRIDSGSHYFSQVLLGWSIAFLSAKAVYQSDLERVPTFQPYIYPRSEGVMVGACYQF